MSWFRHTALRVQRAVNALPLLDGVERLALGRGPHDPLPPVFILGCVRSGSTLLYEVLASTREVAYFSNLAVLFHRAPVLATRLGRRAGLQWQPDYQSRYGFVPGLLAPSEAGALMKRWFRDEDALALAPEGRERIRRSAASLSAAMGGPLVVKNLFLHTVLDRLKETFPDLLVLRMRRDPRFMAQSILKARSEEAGGGLWFGPRPAGSENLPPDDPLAQVAGQVLLIEAEIDQALARTGLGERCLEIAYGTLCRTPGAVLAETDRFYRERAGLDLQPTGIAPPESFPLSERISLKPEEWSRLDGLVRAGAEGFVTLAAHGRVGHSA